MDLCCLLFNTLSRLVITFLPRSKGVILLLSTLWWMRWMGKTTSYSGGQGHAQYNFNPIICLWLGLCSLPVSCLTWSDRALESRLGVQTLVPLLTSVWLFGSPWTAVVKAPVSFTISWNLLKLISIELVMQFNHLILCHPFSFCFHYLPVLGSFLTCQLFISGSQDVEV